MLAVIGLDGLEPVQALGDVSGIDPEAAELLERRQRARAERDFETADRLRERLGELGWEIRDGPEGAELIPRPGP
jgi:cysteinyl-tRNA synthetase